jgi:AcrR family transcriptional regulator
MADSPFVSMERIRSVVLIQSYVRQRWNATDPSRTLGGMPNKRQPAGAAVLQESITSAITAAMFDELAETGYARMSVDAVARRAGVGKAAVYRRWRSKQAMLLDLVGAAVRQNAPEVPDSGSLAGDVRGFLEVILAQAGHPRARRITLDMVAEATRNPELGAALRDAVAPPRRAAAAKVLSRGIERGELSADIDRELGLDLLISPLLMRLLLTGTPVDDTYLTRLTAVIVSGLNAA